MAEIKGRNTTIVIPNPLSKKEKLLHEHEYDPDCQYCANNEFVKEMGSNGLEQVKHGHQ